MDDYLGSLANRPEVRVETTVEELGPDEFAAARERARTIRGGVAVAVVDGGRIALVRAEWMDGYGLPGGGVEPGEGWAAAAAREAEEETGLAVDLDRPWLVESQFFACGDRRCDGGHTVFYLATPRPGERIADDPGIADEEIEDVAWFEAVPERCVQPGRIRAVLDGEV